VSTNSRTRRRTIIVGRYNQVEMRFCLQMVSSQVMETETSAMRASPSLSALQVATHSHVSLIVRGPNQITIGDSPSTLRRAQIKS
jgi:hypothetical protein